MLSFQDLGMFRSQKPKEVMPRHRFNNDSTNAHYSFGPLPQDYCKRKISKSCIISLLIYGCCFLFVYLQKADPGIYSRRCYYPRPVHTSLKIKRKSNQNFNQKFDRAFSQYSSEVFLARVYCIGIQFIGPTADQADGSLLTLLSKLLFSATFKYYLAITSLLIY